MTSHGRQESKLLTQIMPILKRVQKPARYVGGELHSVSKPHDFRLALCFPDIYEIGMSNNAMRLLYAAINERDGLLCDRVFTPADDFASELKQHGLSLYGLDMLEPVRDADILGFTVGYELAATNILHTLELSGIPLTCVDRRDDMPIVIAGGPGISNPVPFGDFLDAVWIGEAETAFYDICDTLRLMKLAGASRAALLAHIHAHPAFWHPGKKAVRNIHSDFSTSVVTYRYPKPVLKPVQHHGVVEVMRGCPNGCRFCHAGYFYRPCRYKNPDLIIREVEALVAEGFTTITLSSLSSGDYPGIFDLVAALNERFRSSGISFQLPSLKVESFSLQLIAELSDVRKGSLTFAVETPRADWQKAINKEVHLEKVLDILSGAKAQGYQTAKFYFMIGLPVCGPDEDEADEIVRFIDTIACKTSLALNITISTFVPKPHTAYQYSKQLSWQDAQARIWAIKDQLRKHKQVKITYNSPQMSTVEGVIARGGAGVGTLIRKAYESGCRFDAWDDQFKKNVWLDLLESHSFPSEAASATDTPWREVSIRVGERFFLRENENSAFRRRSVICTSTCQEPCGSCSDTLRVADREGQLEKVAEAIVSWKQTWADSGSGRLETANLSNHADASCRLFLRFAKFGPAAFYAHHDIHAHIVYALSKAGLMLEYSHGFNPMPRLEISEPLPLGFESDDEYAAARVLASPDELNLALDRYRQDIQKFLPESIRINDILIRPIVDGIKVRSLSSLYWGSTFELDCSRMPGADATKIIQELSMLLVQSDNALLRSSAQVFSTEAPGTLRLVLPATNIKRWGLPALFAESTGKELSGSEVIGRRINQFARDTSDRPSTYFELL